MLATKISPTKLYLVAKHTSITFAEIKEFAETMVPKLIAEIDEQGLYITDSAEFMYYGADGNPETKFTLQVAIPINERSSTTEFEYFESEAFSCAYREYLGAMQGIGDAWRAFVADVLASGAVLSGQDREVYTHWVAFDSPDNITELQVGIA